MNEQKTEPTRPLCLDLEDARQEVTGLINRLASERHIPFYLLDWIVKDAARQVSDLAKLEREHARHGYERQMAEQNNEK